MNIKRILTQTEACIAEQWGSLEQCEHSVAIIDTRADIQQVINESKAVKTQKQHCSKQFKTAAGDAQALDALKQQMQSISATLKNLEEQRKVKEAQLLAFFAEPVTESNTEPAQLPALPRQFQHSATHSSSDDNSDDNTEIITTAPPNISLANTALANIALAKDTDAKAWNSYVEQHSAASLYHRYEWKDFIERTFNQHSYHFIARDSHNNLVGVLPTTRLKSRLFGDFGVSMPYFNYGGVLANSPSIARQLLEAAGREYNTLGASHLEIRTTQPDLIAWPTSTDKVSMIRPLPNTAEVLDQQLGSKLRAQIKRAQRENTQTLTGGLELLDQFYTVFATNMRDLGTPVYSKNLFANILSLWPQQASIVVIQLDGKPVATAFLLGHGDMLEIPWASTLKKVNPLSMNMLLYWEVLSFAIAQKYPFFDFGRSSKDHNTYRFKKQWGAKPVQHHWYYWLQEGQAMPTLKPDNPKFKLLISLWQKLPVFVSKIIGPFIVKNLP